MLTGVKNKPETKPELQQAKVATDLCNTTKCWNELTVVYRPCVWPECACPACRGSSTTLPRWPNVVGSNPVARTPCRDDSQLSDPDTATARSAADEPLSQDHTPR